MQKVWCGLEIHQQLDTEKLFCDCPSILVDDISKAPVIRRTLRAVASELGTVDVAALHEQERGMTYNYKAPKQASCLVELDEEPPHTPNQKALEISFQIVSLLNAKLVDELHFMRKIVIDGSNTTGFQRTALIATDGFVKTKKSRIGIQTICLEEDAARIISRDNNSVTYCLDRLGIPLVEIATKPEITNGEQLKEVAEHIGLILRSCKVKRGLGTIRQDLNINIEGFPRIEIKGAQDLRMLPKIFKLEVERQENLKKLSSIIKNALKNFEFNRFNTVDVSNVFKNTKCRFISKALATQSVVKALKIPLLKSIIGKELCNGKRLGTELADFVKAKTGVSGLLHSDELPNYGITNEEVNKVKTLLEINNKDAFVIIVGVESLVDKALKAVIERLKEFAGNFKPEVRRVLANGITEFLRPLPGSARMYPETDVQPIITKEITYEKPVTILEYAEKLESLSIPKDIALVAAKNHIPVLEYCQRFKKIKPSLIAEIMVVMPKEVKTKTGKSIDILLYANRIFDMLSEGLLTRRGVLKLLEKTAKDNTFSPDEFKILDERELERLAKTVGGTSKKQVFETVMRLYGREGRIEPKTLKDIIERLF